MGGDVTEQTLPTLMGKGGGRNKSRATHGSTGMFQSEAGGSSPTRSKTPTSSMRPNVPGTSEILFLKRLLYLKAAIDNEQTLNTFSVPFSQEQKRDTAPQEMLVFDTGEINMQETDVIEQQKLLSLTEGEEINPKAKTSQGFRPRAPTGEEHLGNMGLGRHLEYKSTDYKKVQTAAGGKRPRRQVMNKSTANNALTANIEANKYITERDRVNERNMEDSFHAKRVANQVNETLPFEELGNN